jgi:hypothetical protein
MNGLDRFDVYRRLFAAEPGETAACWYMGQMFAKPDGLPDILIMQVEAIMFYRAEIVSPNRTRIKWIEIGAFRDGTTGETTGEWRNPVTGQIVNLLTSFTDGPGL